MSKITNDSLTRILYSCTHMATVSVKGLKVFKDLCRCPSHVSPPASPPPASPAAAAPVGAGSVVVALQCVAGEACFPSHCDDSAPVAQ